MSQYPIENSAEPVGQVWTGAQVFPDSGFPLHIFDAAPQPSDTPHVHEGFNELTVACRGAGVHYTLEREHRVRAGDVYIIRGKQSHGYKDVDRLRLKVICFAPARILPQTDSVSNLPGYQALFSFEHKYRKEDSFDSRLRLDHVELAHALALIQVMERELDSRGPGYEYTVIALFMQTVGFLCRCHAQVVNPGNRSLRRMAPVINYIEEHYATHIDLPTLREVAHMSGTALLKEFKQATGQSPIAYLLRVRIARAVDLLHGSSLPITDAAFAVGFSDSNYFTRQFRKIMGMSPSEYRARMVNPPRQASRSAG